MDNIKKAQQRLVNAIVAMHPQLCMGDEKQEELYLAMHDLTSKMAKLNECGGECSNENSGLHLQRVSNSLLPCGFEKCLVDIEGEKMCSFCKYNSNDC